MTLHPTDRIVDQSHLHRNVGSPVIAGEKFDRGSRHIHREKQWPDLVVQVPREIGAFFRLQCHQPPGQPVVLCSGRGKPFSHQIEAVGQACQFGRPAFRYLP